MWRKLSAVRKIKLARSPSANSEILKTWSQVLPDAHSKRVNAGRINNGRTGKPLSYMSLAKGVSPVFTRKKSDVNAEGSSAFLKRSSASRSLTKRQTMAAN
jgi:hypothetical protein